MISHHQEEIYFSCNHKIDFLISLRIELLIKFKILFKKKEDLKSVVLLIAKVENMIASKINIIIKIDYIFINITFYSNFGVFGVLGFLGLRV